MSNTKDGGQTWLLLRGLGRDQRHWGDFPERLKQAFPNDIVLTPDLPGNGALAQLKSPIRIADATDYYRSWLREQGISGPVKLIGLSMGGMVAMDWLNRFPEEIASACVINTSSRLSPPWQRMRPRAMLRLFISALQSTEKLEHQVRLLTTNLQTQPEVLEQEWVNFAKQARPSLLNLLHQLYAAANFQITEIEHKEKLILLASTNDRLVNVNASRAIAKHLNIPLSEHPTAGHDFPLDDGEWIVCDLTTFDLLG